MALEIETKAKEAFIDDHFELAVELYSQAIDIDNTKAELYADLAQAFIKLNKFTNAVSNANRAIEMDPLMSKAYLRKGLACVKLKDYYTAKEVLNKGASIAPEDYRFSDLIKECDKHITEDVMEIYETPKQEDSKMSAPYTGIGILGQRSTTTPVNEVPDIPRYRYDYYEKPDVVVVSIFAKGVSSDHVTVEFGDQVLSAEIDIPGQAPYHLHLRLFGKIVPARCEYHVLSTKIEIRLAKAEHIIWSALEFAARPVLLKNTAGPLGIERPSYPSSRQNTDWDKLEAQVKKEEKDEKLDGDAALNKFFRDIFRDADEDTRRAMNKSFVESNGTVLSTNWKDVGAKTVKGSPPDGMELKRWEY